MVYESNKSKVKNGWEFKEQRLAIDTGDKVNDINIQEAIIHVLDVNADEPILNEFTLELNEDIYRFLYKHMEKQFRSDELIPAIFNQERNIVKEIVQDYLNGIGNNLVSLSQELAKQMFYIVKGNKDIPSADLIVASLVTDQGPIIAILKMDYAKNFTHKIDFIENKIGIGIVEQVTDLPGSTNKIHKAAFIKPFRKYNGFDLWVIDKQKKYSDDEYGANWFMNNFLGCTEVVSNRLATKKFIEATETFVRHNITEDAEKAEKIRTMIKDKLIFEEVIDIDKVAAEIFNQEPKAQEMYKTMINSYGLEDEIKVDKAYVDKKLKKVRLKVDRDIDVYISQEAYKDPSKFEVVRNGDGSINLVIKHVINYIEK